MASGVPRPAGFSEHTVSPDTDLLVQDVIGIRTFRVGDDGALLPVTQKAGDAWKTGLNEAQCIIQKHRDSHLPPAADCSCGFYSYTHLPEVAASGYEESAHVLAAVKNEGRLLYGDRGVRAQYARLEAVWFSEAVPPEVVGKVLHRYPEVGDQYYRNRTQFLKEHRPSSPATSPLPLGDVEPGPARRAGAAFNRGCAHLAAWAAPPLCLLVFSLALVREGVVPLNSRARGFVSWTQDDLGADFEVLTWGPWLLAVVAAVAVTVTVGGRWATPAMRHVAELVIDVLRSVGMFLLTLWAIWTYEDTSVGTLTTGALVMVSGAVAKLYLRSGQHRRPGRGSNFTLVPRTGFLAGTRRSGWTLEGAYPLRCDPYLLFEDVAAKRRFRTKDAAVVSVLRHGRLVLLFVQEVHDRGRAVLSPETNGWYQAHLTDRDDVFAVVSGAAAHPWAVAPLMGHGIKQHPGKIPVIPSTSQMILNQHPATFVDADDMETLMTLPDGVWVPPALRVDVSTTLEAITSDKSVCVPFKEPGAPHLAEDQGPVGTARSDGDAWLHQRWFRDCQESLAATPWTTNIHPEVPAGGRLPADQVVAAWEAIFRWDPVGIMADHDSSVPNQEVLADYYNSVWIGLPAGAQCHITRHPGRDTPWPDSAVIQEPLFGHQVLFNATNGDAHDGRLQWRITTNNEPALARGTDLLIVLDTFPGSERTRLEGDV